jgi:hypothetical protein
MALVVDEVIESSSGDRTEIIVHRPVLFTIDAKTGKRDYTLEKNQESDRGEPYVGPLPKEKGGLNMREIAGNRAYEYIIGKRNYDLTGRAEDREEGNGSSSVINIGKWFLLAIALSGVAILAALHFFPAGR